jgi:Family of unknown function (DUF6505)
VKLPRTIRLDPSDTLVFPAAADPGEWAVVGSFMFLDADPAALTGKHRVAFRSGFLGLASFGWSTLVVVTPALPDEVAQATDQLARRIRADLGAPDDAAALAAAREEIAFAASICADLPTERLIAMHRFLDDDGHMREQFRTLTPREKTKGADGLHAHSRAFEFVEEMDDGPEERADLIGLMATETRR